METRPLRLGHRARARRRVDGGIDRERGNDQADKERRPGGQTCGVQDLLHSEDHNDPRLHPERYRRKGSGEEARRYGHLQRADGRLGRQTGPVHRLGRIARIRRDRDLAATPTSGNQNTWIKFMKLELKKKAYKNMKLVKIAYGNDNPTDSAKQTQSLLQAYPKLKGIIAPTTVGIQAAAQELQQEKKCKSVALTGLGLPNDMRKYVKKGCAKKFGLWNEKDLGYLATYVAHYVASGKLTGKLGQTFTAGRLGKFKVVKSDGNKPVVVLGPPLVFTPKNIDKYHF